MIKTLRRSNDISETNLKKSCNTSQRILKPHVKHFQDRSSTLTNSHQATAAVRRDNNLGNSGGPLLELQAGGFLALKSCRQPVGRAQELQRAASHVRLTFCRQVLLYTLRETYSNTSGGKLCALKSGIWASSSVIRRELPHLTTDSGTGEAPS